MEENRRIDDIFLDRQHEIRMMQLIMTMQQKLTTNAAA